MDIRNPLTRLLVAWLMATLLTGINTHTLLAATYYVNVRTGDDDATASEAQDPDTPWSSLTRALAEGTLASGDVINVAPGDYYADNEIPRMKGDAARSGEGGEIFPLSLVSDVAIIGSGRDTRIMTSNADSVFVGSGDLGQGTELANVALMVDENGDFDKINGKISGIQFEGDGVSQEPVLTDIYFAPSLDTGLYFGYGSGTNSFAGQVTSNAFDQSQEGLNVGVLEASALDWAPMISGNSFSGGYFGIYADLSSVSGTFNLSPDIHDNDAAIDEGGFFLVNAYASGGSLSVSPTITGNTFRVAGTLLGIQMTSISVSSGELTFAPIFEGNDISGSQSMFGLQANNLTGPGGLDLLPLMSNNTVSDVTKASDINLSSISSMSVNIAAVLVGNEGALAYGSDVYGYGLSDLNLTHSVLVSNNSLSMRYAVEFSVSSFGSGSLSSNITLEDNVLVGGEDTEDIVDLYAYQLNDIVMSETVLVTGNTVAEVDGLVDMSLSSATSITYDANVVIQDNTLSDLQDEILEVDLNYLYSSSATLSYLMSGNTASDVEGGIDMSVTSNSSGTVDLDVEFVNNVLEGFSDSALEIDLEYLYDSVINSDVLVHGNTLSGGSDGVSVSLSSMSSSAFLNSRLTVTDNDISGMSEAGVEYFIDYIYGGSDIQSDLFIAGNTITDTSEPVYGYIYSITSANIESDVVIVSNTISGGDDEAIDWSWSSFSEVSGREDLLIAGNTITNRGDDGIALEISEMSSFSGTLDLNWTVANNTISGIDDDGIVIDVDSISSISGSIDLTVIGNTISDVSGSGIDVYFDGESATLDAHSVIIAGNTVSQSGQDGVYFNHSGTSGTAELLSNRLTANVISSNLGDGINISSQGGSGAGVVLSGNTISSNTGFGVDLSVVSGSSASIAYASLGVDLPYSPGLNTFVGNGDGSVYAGPGSGDTPIFAANNYWGTTDSTAIEASIVDFDDDLEGEELADVQWDFADVLDAMPSVAATASLSVVLSTDIGGAGNSPEDTYTFTATLEGTGEIGCASATFYAALPDGAVIVEDSIQTERGSALYGDNIHIALGWLPANQSVTVRWDMQMDAETCDDVVVQGVLRCTQLGEVFTNETTVSYVDYTYYTDGDADGEGDAEQAYTTCLTEAPEGYVDNADDCDDDNELVNGNATEVCDGIDNDCNGDTDEGLTTTYYADYDGDGYTNADISIDACVAPAGFSDGDSGDCDDTRSDINPGATEICDLVDNDCDGETDEEGASTLWVDSDGDGFGEDGTAVETCGVLDGYALVAGDCDDSKAEIFPGAAELCDDIDNDCDDLTDEGAGDVIAFIDEDGDGYGMPGSAETLCDLGEGFADNGEDCDDANADINPLSTEVCDEVDNDCDGLSDEGLGGAVVYADVDEDGYGDPQGATVGCGLEGYVGNAWDCDDSDASISPDGTEVCDGQDNDCDRDTDEGVGYTYYSDDDDDGYGDALTGAVACEAQSGAVDNGMDCDDSDASINPEGTEVCDGEDNDCDRDTDEGVENTYYTDADSDGFGNAFDSTTACEAPTGFVDDGTDCDDDEGEIYPGAVEVCDDIDNDCNGEVDESADCIPSETATPTAGDGGGEGCSTTGTPNGASLLGLMLLGLFMRPRRREEGQV